MRNYVYECLIYFKNQVIILWGVMAILGFYLDYIGTELQSTNGDKPVRYFFFCLV